MKWIKAIIVGAVAALVMFLLIAGAIQSGIAPFELTPSAAFLTTLGLPVKPLALIIHFAYGIFWSLILIALFKQRTHIGHGLGLSIVLWLILMLVYSPLIGWGFFGAADTADLPEKLQLGNTGKYIAATLVVHLVYGAIIGWLNPLWIRFNRSGAQASPASPASTASTAQSQTSGSTGPRPSSDNS